ncbi:MAG: PQQ-binding-like beta-propeller repeat protein [Myxococcota bacterium]
MRVRGLAGMGLALALGVAACGPTGRIEVIHPEGSDAARAVMRVAMTQQVTVPDNFIMRPDEFGAVAVDHPRQLLYVGSREGTLLALDMLRGEVMWELPLGGAVSSRPLLTDMPGEAGTRDPAAPHGMMLVGTDNGDEIAIDLESREELWRYPTDGKVRTVPVVAEGVVYIANSRDQVFALDQRTGAWRWQYEQPLQTDFTVSGYAGLAYVPSSDGVGTGVVYTGFGNGKVVAIDAASGEALWLTSLAPPAGGDFSDCDSTPLVNPEAGRLYVAGQQTGVFALDLEDGTPAWSFGVRAVGDLARGAGGDMVGASSLEGVFALDRDGNQLWRTQVDPGVLSTPVVVDNTVFVAHSDAGLLAFDLESGEFLARLDPGSGVSSLPVYDGVLGRLYATSNRGVLYGIELLDDDVAPGDVTIAVVAD